MTRAAGSRALGHSVAVAHANIALIKYWGKREGPGNLPATPSIALALKELATTTSVSRGRGQRDSFELDGRPAKGDTLMRLQAFLDLWRARGLLDGHFHVASANSFPTAAGLASSSSGYAALTYALAAFNGLRLEPDLITGEATVRPKLVPSKQAELARQGSGSAARSIMGGLSFLTVAGGFKRFWLPPASEIPWGMVICIVDALPKAVSSRVGMELCRQTSPYYATWLKQGQRDYTALLAALALKAEMPTSDPRFDFTAAAPLIERNCLAMHACMLAADPPLVYWSPATLEVIAAVKDWRAAGRDVCFTIDAGPHVALLCRRDELAAVAQAASQIRGVRQVVPSEPGGAPYYTDLQWT